MGYEKSEAKVFTTFAFRERVVARQGVTTVEKSKIV
jgi:hypothetical protein